MDKEDFAARGGAARAAAKDRAEARMLLWRPRYSLARDGCMDSVVTVAVEVEVTKRRKVTEVEPPRPVSSPSWTWLEHGETTTPVDPPSTIGSTLRFARLGKLRETKDLLYMLLVLYSAMVLQATDANRPRTMDEALAARVLEQRGPLTLCVTLIVKDLEELSLLDQLGELVAASLARTVSADPAFESVRTELEDELVKCQPAWRTRLATHPVVLRFAIETPQRCFSSRYDFLAQRPRFMENYLAQIEPGASYLGGWNVRS